MKYLRKNSQRQLVLLFSNMIEWSLPPWSGNGACSSHAGTVTTWSRDYQTLACVDPKEDTNESGRTYWGRCTARLVNNGLALDNGRRLPHLGFSTSTPIATTVHAMRACCTCGAWRSRPRDLGHCDRRMAEALCGGSGCSRLAHPALWVSARCVLTKGDALHGETERTIGRLISSRGIC